MAEPTFVDLAVLSDGARLAAVASGRPAALVMLHPGVADSRCWRTVMRLLAPQAPSLAIDMRGFGGTPPAEAPYSQLDDLHAAIVAHCDAPVTLIGNSQGGALAIDYTLARPDTVRRLILVASAVTGAPAPDWASEIGQERVDLIEAAEAAGDLDEVNRVEAHVWLDGAGQLEGRVGGAARDLFLAMNRIALANETAPQPIPPPAAFTRLHELAVPVLVLVGSLDLPHQRERSRLVAERVPQGHLVTLEGVAHVPQLEAPEVVARAIRAFLG